MRWRTAVASLGLAVGLIAYVAAAATLADAFGPMHWAAALVYYVVAGVGWVYPAIRAVAWAGRDGPSPARKE